jgi:hypothetical protein
MNQFSLVAGGHLLAAFRTSPANVRAQSHHFIVTHALAVFSTFQASFGANAADLQMKIRIPHHKVRRGSTDVSTRKKRFDVGSFGMLSAFFKAIR